VILAALADWVMMPFLEIDLRSTLLENPFANVLAQAKGGLEWGTL
jgi:hypothetical protein